MISKADESCADSLERYLGSEGARTGAKYALRLLALQVSVSTAWGFLRPLVGVPPHSHGLDADFLIRILLMFAACVGVSAHVAVRYHGLYISVALPAAILAGIGNWVLFFVLRGSFSLPVLGTLLILYLAMFLGAGAILGFYGRKR